MYILKKKKRFAGVFIVTGVGIFWHWLGSCLLYLLVFLPSTSTEQPKNSPRAAGGRARQTAPPWAEARREAADLLCSLLPTHGCSASTFQQGGPQGASLGWVCDTLALHVNGESPEMGDHSSRQPRDRAWDGRKTVGSNPPHQLQGLGFGGYPDLEAMGNLGSCKLG